MNDVIRMHTAVNSMELARTAIWRAFHQLDETDKKEEFIDQMWSAIIAIDKAIDKCKDTIEKVENED